MHDQHIHATSVAQAPRGAAPPPPPPPPYNDALEALVEAATENRGGEALGTGESWWLDLDAEDADAAFAGQVMDDHLIALKGDWQSRRDWKIWAEANPGAPEPSPVPWAAIRKRMAAEAGREYVPDEPYSVLWEIDDDELIQMAAAAKASTRAAFARQGIPLTAEHEALFEDAPSPTTGKDDAEDDAEPAQTKQEGPEPPPAPGPGTNGKDESVVLDIRSSWKVPPPARRWLVDGWLPADRITMLAGRGAAGKSQIALQLAHAIARDLPAGVDRTWFLNGPSIPEGQGSVAFASWEDDADEILRRMMGNPGLTRGAPEFDHEVGGRFHFIDVMGRGPLWAINAGHQSYGELTPVGASLREACQSMDVRLLVIDALSSAYAANENERAAVRAFLSSWDRWARDAGCTVLLIAHPPKSEGKDAHYSGSTDWRAGVRSLLVLDRPKGVADRARLTCDKLNAAKAPDAVALGSPRWWSKIDIDPIEIDSSANLDLRDRVVAALKEHGPMNRTQIRAAVQKGKTAVDETLARMELDKSLSMALEGNAKIYSLAGRRPDENRAENENDDDDIPF